MYVHQSIIDFLFGGARVLDFLNLKPFFVESKAIFCFSKQQGSSEEWAMFHLMFRILEATKGLCLPLPPGKRTSETIWEHFGKSVFLLHAY